MTIFAETERLILRELLPADDAGMFELDSNPDVHRYLGGKPLTDIQQSRDVITFIRKQYADNGIGRWAVIEKSTGDFTGWCGLKLITEMTNAHINFYDVGYRFIKRYWGKGYATESALAVMDYGFNQIHLKKIYGMADIGNAASNQILQKIGLKFVNTFDYDGDKCNWYES